MHLLISHAAPQGAQCQAAMTKLVLPHFNELLGLLTASPPLLGTPDMLTPLSERVRASNLGLQGADGLVPWAAADAQQLGLTKVHGNAGWAWITPCHWTVHADHVDMSDPQELAITSAECEALRVAMQGYFSTDGITLHPLSNGTWLAFGAVLRDLPTASLERVSGARVDHWIPRQAQAQSLRRLQNEMQMLLYTHPVNDARSARGVATVNSFWISGTGTLQAGDDALTVPPGNVEHIDCNDALRQSALHDDAPAWLAAWHTLDSTVMADLLKRAKAGAALQLTLCGERMAVTLELQDKPWWNRLQQRFTASSPLQLLHAL